jgi:patatin-like phospholipase/acyl hydrolase
MTSYRKLRILSLDGGGVRGIMSAQILLRIENILKTEFGSEIKIGDYFDIVAGTSTGGIITSIILLKNDKNELIYSAKDVVDLYYNNNNKIFKKTFLHKIKTFFGFFGSQFKEDGIENVLQTYFKDIQLKELKKPSLICSYDTNNRKCVIFKQHLAEIDDAHNFYLKDVVRATTAAPLYFKPAKIKSITGDEYSLIDGGIYANNPAMCALVEVNKIFEKENGRKYNIRDIKILSLGTGEYNKRYVWDKIKKWGLVNWIIPFIDMTSSSTNEVTDYQLSKLYEYNNCPENYLRIDVNLSKKERLLDNTDINNINNLINIGNNVFEINKETIIKFIKL